MSTHDRTTPDELPDPADLPLFSQRAPGPRARRLAGGPGPAQPTATETTPAHQAEAGTPDHPTWRPQGAPTAQPAAERPPAAALPPLTDPPDWALVRQLREQVSERIKDRPDATATRLDRDVHGELARSLAVDEILTHSQRQAMIGQPPLTQAQTDQLTTAVLDSIFGLGRLEQLVNQDGIEDVIVRGCDHVWLYYGDGRRVRGPAVADSDEELIADIAHLAATSPYGERSFSPASRTLNLALPGGHRLSAVAWNSRRPLVTIRRHGHRDIDLDQLVELGAIDQTLRHFLSAAILAGVSVVVSGLPSAGKTTLIRALLNVLHPSVAFATIESEFELGLHSGDGRHDCVWDVQASPGGEGGAGEVTLGELVSLALRQSVDRIVVGEVRGSEILAMFDAMDSTQGSVCTVHATSALDTVERLVTCAIKAPEVNTEFAYRQVAHHVGIIVNLGVIDETTVGGRKHRFVREVTEVFPATDTPTKVGHRAIFEPGSDGRAVPTGKRPDWLDALEHTGFDPAWLTAGAATWGAPIPNLANTRGEAS